MRFVRSQADERYEGDAIVPVGRTTSQVDWDALDACIWSTVAAAAPSPVPEEEDDEEATRKDAQGRRVCRPAARRRLLFRSPAGRRTRNVVEERRRSLAPPPVLMVPCYAYGAENAPVSPTSPGRTVLDVIEDNAGLVAKEVMKTPEAQEAVLDAVTNARGAGQAIVDRLARDDDAARSLCGILLRSDEAKQVLKEMLEDLLATRRGHRAVSGDALVVRLHGVRRGHNKMFSSECMGQGGCNIFAMRERNDIQSPIQFDDDSVGDGFTTTVRCVKGPTAPHVDAIAAYVKAKAEEWLSGYPSTMGVTASYKGRALFEVWGDEKED